MYRAEEDYLKFMYEFQMNHKTYVQVKDIADYFEYTEQSVYEMIKKLQKNGLAIFVPYKGVELTENGKQEAIRMMRAHRIWEVFLGDYLGYSWDEVHEEAEMLEHASSEKLLKKLYNKLGKPKTCQHGNVIPTFDGEITPLLYKQVSEMSEGDTCIIKKVLDKPELLTYLKQHNININETLKIINKDEFHGLIDVLYQGQKMTLSIKTSAMMYGEIIN